MSTEALAQAPADVDPSRTKTLRRRYAQSLRGGFDEIAAAVREGVREDDIFRLAEREPDVRSDELLAAPPNPRVFRFSGDAERVANFEEWLSEAHQKDVLSVISEDGNEFVRAGYGRGIKHANARLREEGVDVPDESLENIFRKPVHRNKLELLFTKNFRGLVGVTREVEKQSARVLADSLAEGVSPDEASRRLTDRIDKIGRTRATTLARTAIIDAHSEATLNRFERMGVSKVSGKAEADDAEFKTAGDTRVCPRCASLEGQTFTIAEARGVIPVHARCRCVWIPIV